MVSTLRFCPDTAQLALGDMDLSAIFRRYAARMSYVHFKDLDDDRRMREVGGGVVVFEPLRDLLEDSGYEGWVCTDLDYVTGMSAIEAATRSLSRLDELFPSGSDDGGRTGSVS